MTKKTFSRGKKVLSQSYTTLLVRKVSYSGDDGISMQLLVEKRKENILGILCKRQRNKMLSSVQLVVLLTIVQY